jgi:hypothetical protein
MSRWVTKLYPFLFALVPILYFAARNTDQFDFGDLALMLGVIVAGCGLVYGFAALAIGGRGPAALPPFVAMLGVAWFFGYPRAARPLSGEGMQPAHAILIPAGLALLAALLWWIRRRERLLEGIGRFLTLTGALLVGWSTVQIGAGWLRGRSPVADSALAGELARPIEGPASPSGPRRDVYLIVLDAYANSDVLRERFGYDNRPFEDSLRALGFHVPRLVRSNYFHTLLSLPSLLNSAHLDGLEHELGPKNSDPALPNNLLERNRVAPYLEARGYRYVFFPSQWWHSTRTSSVADAEFRPWSGFDLTRAIASGELQRTVSGVSILRYLDRDHHWEADHARRTFKGLAALPRAGGPVFAFAHILKPHDPYVFDRECRTLDRQKEVDDVAPYLEQVECVNRLVLDTVREILRASEVPPIILLQGDHGTRLLDATKGYPSSEQVPPAAARERFGAFGAYYLPDGGAAAFGDTVTVVNVLGNVLRYYFGAHLPRAGDELYISPAAFPYEFRRVDARWLAGDDSAGPKLPAGGRRPTSLQEIRCPPGPPCASRPGWCCSPPAVPARRPPRRRSCRPTRCGRSSAPSPRTRWRAGGPAPWAPPGPRGSSPNGCGATGSSRGATAATSSRCRTRWCRAPRARSFACRAPARPIRPRSSGSATST